MCRGCPCWDPLEAASCPGWYDLTAPVLVRSVGAVVRHGHAVGWSVYGVSQHTPSDDPSRAAKSADTGKHPSTRHRCFCPCSLNCLGVAFFDLRLGDSCCCSLMTCADPRRWISCGSSCCHHHQPLDHGGDLVELLSLNTWLIGLTCDVSRGNFVSRSRVQRVTSFLLSMLVKL